MKRLFFALLFFLLLASGVSAGVDDEFMSYGHNWFFNDTAEQGASPSAYGWTTSGTPTYSTEQAANGSKSIKLPSGATVDDFYVENTFGIPDPFNITFKAYYASGTIAAGQSVTFNFGAKGATEAIFGFGNAGGVGSGNYIYFRGTGSWTDSGFAVPRDQWVTQTFYIDNANTFSWWSDGSLVATGVLPSLADDDIHFVKSNAQYNVYFDDIHVWNETITAAPVTTPYAHIKLLDSYDNSSISGVTVYLGTESNVTDGSGIAYFYNHTTGLNYSVSDASYFGATGTATENATTNVNLYQGFTNISSFVNLAGEAISVSGFNLTVAGGRTYTSANVSGPFYLTDGSNSLTASIVDYLGGSGTATISAPENTSASITGLYNHTLTLQANNAENGSMINSFNVTVYADWNNLTGATTNGTLTFGLLSGRSYTIAYEADGYLPTNVSHSPTNATQYFNTSLYRKQAYFNFTFRNETNRAILNDTFITFNTVDANNLYTPFNTSTGTANLVVGFVPGLYTIRYAADGYSNRDYYIYLEYNNTYVLDLFLIPNDVYGPGVVEVRDPDGSPREDAIIEMKRYYGLNGTTFEIVSMATSNNVGEAVMLAEPVNAFYTWRVLVDNVVRYETFTPELLALESDGLWHQIFILNGTGTGYNDQTGILYNWTYRNNTLYNGSIYPLGISFSSSVASISDCSLSILDAGDRSVLNTTSGFCTSGGGSTFLLHTAVTDENVILVATYTVNGEEYEIQNYYAIRTLPASEFTLKTALDRFSAFDGGGFNDSTRFLLAVVLTILLTLGVATKTDLMNSPEEIMLFVFVTTLFFSYAGWLYIPIETIPFPELRQYLLSVIVGIIAVVMFYRKSGVSSQ